jgi:multidrug efflux pump
MNDAHQPAGAASRGSIAGRIVTTYYYNSLLLWLTLIIIAMAGIAALGQLPRLEDPRITLRNAQILTILPGATAERVEALVTEPLEDLLDEIDQIRELASTSRNNVSLILVELDDAITADDNAEVFAEIRARLREADGLLPPDASAPRLDDNRGATAFGTIVSVAWRDGAARDLGTLGRVAQTLGDRLRVMSGTELVRYYGAPEEQITVSVDAAAIAAAGLRVDELAQRVRGADAKNAAGRLRNVERDLSLELAGELDGAARIARIPIRADGAAGLLTVGDVATIERGWRDPPRDIALRDGERAIFIAARPEVTQRVDDWGRQMRETVAAFASEAGSQFEIDIVFDQSQYVDARLSTLSGNLFAGAAVVMLIVLLLMGWRAALIVGLALPLSSAIAIFGLSWCSLQLHQMTIFGLLIAIGLLIDSAIVVTDEVQRRLREGGDRERAARGAVDHLFTPLWTSTFTTVLGFMPIFLLAGNIGDFVGPIAVSVILALLASFALSVSVIPALAARHLGTTPARTPADSARGSRRNHGRPTRVGWLRDGLQFSASGPAYRRLLRLTLARPLATVAITSAIALSGFVAASQLGLQFFPSADRDQFEIEVWFSPETSIETTRRSAEAIEAVVREQSGVAGIDWLIGGSFPSVYYNLVMNKDDTPYYAQAIVTAESVADAERLVPVLQQALDARFANARLVVSPFGQGPPIAAPIGFRLYGPDTDTLARYGEQIRRVMHEVPGVLHSYASVRGGQPKLRLDVNEYAATLSGLTLNDIAGQLQTSLEGGSGGSVLEDTESLNVRIRVPDALRGSVREIANLRLLSAESVAGGDWIPASALGELTLVPEKASITRRNGVRVNEILGYTSVDVLPIEVTREIVARLEAQAFSLPPGYRLEVAGDSEEQREAIGALVAYAPLLGLAMAATVILSFSSLALGAVIGAVALLSVGLGMLSLFLAGFPLGFNPLIGSAGLIGVAINGSIVVLAAIRANPLARRGEPDAIIEEVTHSTRHLVATSLTTTAGFGPLLLGGGSFWPPLAVVIAGGVALSLMLSLGFTPAIYRLLSQHAARREQAEQARPWLPTAEGEVT